MSNIKLRNIILPILLEKLVLGTDKVIPLDAIDPELAKAVIGGGFQDGMITDDQIEAQKISVSVKDLKPAQQEVILEKALEMCLNNLITGQPDLDDLGGIISDDDYIMDGHHRWSSSFLQNPENIIKVTKVEIPGPALVSALNVITVGKLGVTKGNAGEGNVSEFTGENIRKVITKFIKNGTYQLSKEQVVEALRLMPNSNGDINTAIRLLSRHADMLPKDIMRGAPPRNQMPVVDTKYVPLIRKMFASGAFDIKEPYSPKVKKNISNMGALNATV